VKNNRVKRLLYGQQGQQGHWWMNIMENKLIFIILLLSSCSDRLCSDKPVVTEYAKINSKCTVYRIEHDCIRDIYTTNCEGSTSWERPSGKSKVIEEVETK